jgi:hypothetical protein
VIREYDLVRLGLSQCGVTLPPEPRALGSGAYATAYATEDGRVVKITGDRKERFAAMLVRDNPQPFIVRVDHVFAYDRQTVIVAERLTKIPEELRVRWKTLQYDLTRIGQHGPQIQRNGKWSPNTGAESVRHTGRPMAPEDWDLLEYQENIARSLLDAGITNADDVHYDNVMIRPSTGQIVVSDLGHTASQTEIAALPIPQPGIECGDDGDVHITPPPPKPPVPPVFRAPDPAAVRWNRDEVAWHPHREKCRPGQMFKIAQVDAERGVVRLEKVPERSSVADIRLGPPQRLDERPHDLPQDLGWCGCNMTDCWINVQAIEKAQLRLRRDRPQAADRFERDMRGLKEARVDPQRFWRLQADEMRRAQARLLAEEERRMIEHFRDADDLFIERERIRKDAPENQGVPAPAAPPKPKAGYPPWWRF